MKTLSPKTNTPTRSSSILRPTTPLHPANTTTAAPTAMDNHNRSSSVSFNTNYSSSNERMSTTVPLSQQRNVILYRRRWAMLFVNEELKEKKNKLRLKILKNNVFICALLI